MFPHNLFTAALARVLLLFVLMLPAPAAAQLVPSVLEEVKLVTADDDQASFMLRFSPAEPQYAATGSNPRRPELILRTTVKAPRVEERLRPGGIVRSAGFETVDSALVMRFDTAAPAQIRAAPAGDRVVQVTVSRLSDEEALGSRPLGSTAEEVAPASELPVAGPYGADAYAGMDAGAEYELVMLKYADVSEVIGILVGGEAIEPNNVFIRREPGFGSLASTTQSAYMGPQVQDEVDDQPLGQSFPGTGLAIDRRLNAVWITGDRQRIETVKRQIAMIDVPVDSVILETQFVELTETGARNLGLDLTNSAGQIAVGNLATGSFLPFGVDPNDVLPSGQVQAAIYAQIQKGEGRIVSRPRIAAQSGTTAKIITGDALPILTSITLSGVNGVSQQVQYVNVGVTLQIAPRVSADGFVTSKIYGVVSSVTGFSQGYPTISQREAETSASVRDGETFVIGGLTQDNVLTTKGKIPLLGDIPLVGNLFRNERSSRAKTELYIVITPRIVRHRRFERAEPQDDTAAESVVF